MLGRDGFRADGCGIDERWLGSIVDRVFLLVCPSISAECLSHLYVLPSVRTLLCRCVACECSSSGDSTPSCRKNRCRWLSPVVVYCCFSELRRNAEKCNPILNSTTLSCLLLDTRDPTKTGIRRCSSAGSSPNSCNDDTSSAEGSQSSASDTSAQVEAGLHNNYQGKC